jgi:D-alanyl-lipoteichoic acid acyltransferase DltB (MBOAT superfamily)
MLLNIGNGGISALSTVLKNLFFVPFKKMVGLPIAIFLSLFSVLAMWHGVTLNFVIWGVFMLLDGY